MPFPIRRSSPIFLIPLLACLAPSAPARAEATDHKIANFASFQGNLLYLGLGAALPLVEDGKDGRSHALRAVEATGISVAFSEILKQTIHERRPNGSQDRKSFPSGHATAAFAIATAQSAFHPKQAPLWYGGAALIGWSRVRLNRHHWHDVAAGAALGYLTTRWELSRPHGLLLTPWIHPDTGATGLQISKGF
jgi:membrane-associated phospholipid phosphatase